MHFLQRLYSSRARIKMHCKWLKKFENDSLSKYHSTCKKGTPNSNSAFPFILVDELRYEH